MLPMLATAMPRPDAEPAQTAGIDHPGSSSPPMRICASVAERTRAGPVADVVIAPEIVIAPVSVGAESVLADIVSVLAALAMIRAAVPSWNSKLVLFCASRPLDAGDPDWSLNLTYWRPVELAAINALVIVVLSGRPKISWTANLNALI